MGSELSYKKSGVDIDEGERFVKLISPIAKKTFRPEVLTDIGLFSALFKLDLTRYKEPVLVSGTDGVGTKLKIAFMMDKHDTVGIDLVAMCVNDILTTGAEPLFFLGVVDQEKIINGSSIKEGDVIIGLASNGLHSNGYSLIRKLFFDMKKMNIETYVPELGVKLGDELLKPTRIYVKAFIALKDSLEIKGMAHITGGGIPGNLLRILPEGICANIRNNSWPAPPIFKITEKIGKISA